MPAIFHQEQGAGKPIVFLHGFCETSEVWSPLIGDVAGYAHAFRVDLPGFGKSELPPTPFSLEDIARFLWAWVDEQEIQNPVIIGHSLGGYVTLAMASQRPHDVAGFGLFHSTALADSAEKKENRTKVIEFVSKNGVSPFIDTFVPSLFADKNHPAIPGVDKMARATKKDTLLAYTAAMRDRPEKVNFLHQFEKPVLILAGEKDGVIPMDSLKNQAGNLKKGQYFALEGVGHMGMHEDTAGSLKSIRAFFDACLDATF